MEEPASSAPPPPADDPAQAAYQTTYLTRTDPDGVTTTWTYTPGNLTASVSYSGGSAHSASYGYDADGNKVSMSDSTGSSGYGYDPFGERRDDGDVVS